MQSLLVLRDLYIYVSILDVIYVKFDPVKCKHNLLFADIWENKVNVKHI